MKLKLSLGMLFTLISMNASAVTYSDWIGYSNSWKYGYVFSYADNVTSNNPYSPGFALGYTDCLNGFTGEAMVKVVDDYMSRNPASKANSMIHVIGAAFFELCQNKLPAPNETSKSKRKH